jgi:hypothetical protein
VAGLSKSAVIKLILEYIGGAKLQQAKTVYAEGKKISRVASGGLSFPSIGGAFSSLVQSKLSGLTPDLSSLLPSNLQSAVTGALGEVTDVESIKDKLFSNPVAPTISDIQSKVSSVTSTVNGLANLSAAEKQTITDALGTFSNTVSTYETHTNILSGITDPVQDPTGSDGVDANTVNTLIANNTLVLSKANSDWVSNTFITNAAAYSTFAQNTYINTELDTKLTVTSINPMDGTDWGSLWKFWDASGGGGLGIGATEGGTTYLYVESGHGIVEGFNATWDLGFTIGRVSPAGRVMLQSATPSAHLEFNTTPYVGNTAIALITDVQLAANGAAGNTYVTSTFAQNTYVNSTFSQNTYVNTQLGLKANLSGATFTGPVTLDGYTTANQVTIYDFAEVRSSVGVGDTTLEIQGGSTSGNAEVDFYSGGTFKGSVGYDNAANQVKILTGGTAELLLDSSSGVTVNTNYTTINHATGPELDFSVGGVVKGSLYADSSGQFTTQATGLLYFSSGTAGSQFNQKVLFAAPTTSRPSINLPHGTAPTTPANGDMWTTTSGLFGRIASATWQFANVTYAASNTVVYSTFAQNTYVNSTFSQNTYVNTQLSNKINTSEKGAASGVATLDSGGKVPSTQLPAIAITSTYTANNQTEQLALSTQEGDVVVRLDANTSYIRLGTSTGTMSDYQELLAPTSGGTVTSVNGKTGPTVTLTATDVGSSATGNISATNVQAAIAELDSEKASLSGATFTGEVATNAGIVGNSYRATSAASTLALKDGNGNSRVSINTTGAAISGSLTAPPTSIARSDGTDFAATISHTGGTVSRHGLKITTTGTSGTTDVLRVDTGGITGALVIDGGGNSTFAGDVTGTGAITINGYTTANQATIYDFAEVRSSVGVGDTTLEIRGGSSSGNAEIDFYSGGSIKGTVGYDNSINQVKVLTGGTAGILLDSSIGLTVNTHFTTIEHATGPELDFSVGGFVKGALYADSSGQLTTQASGLLYFSSGTAGSQFNQKVLFAAPTTSRPSINLPHGTAPTTPANGDMWTTTSGLYARIAGATKGPFVDSATLSGSGYAGNTYVNSTFAQNTYVNSTFAQNTYVNTQLGLKANNDGTGATGTWPISITGNSNTSNSSVLVSYTDNRTLNEAPSTYDAKSISADFKTFANADSPPVSTGSGYSHLVTLSGWTPDGGGGGGRATQLASGAGLAWRQAANSTTWGSWFKLYDSNDAASANTASKLVIRDSTGSINVHNLNASGNVAITGTLTPGSGGIVGFTNTANLNTSLGLKANTGAITSSGLTISTSKLAGRTTASTGAVEEVAVDSTLSLSSTTLGMSSNQKTRTITFVIDGGGFGSPISTGIKGFIEVPFSCTINSVTLLANQSGSIVVDIWKDTYANFPPTVADTITASAKPTLSSAQNSQNTTLTGWTTSITAGDILAFNVDSATIVQHVTLSLKVTVT